jgi:hypothetical protein
VRSLADIEAAAELAAANADEKAGAAQLLALGEEVLEHWIRARGDEPTNDMREGFRILALHRQGTKGDPSFNACRETTRELVYQYNLIYSGTPDTETTDRLQLMTMIFNHLYLFISGKLQVAQLGEFCCSSKPIRMGAGSEILTTKEA